MADSVSTTEHVGVFSALLSSIKKVAAGVAFLCIAPLMLFMNECSSVETAKSLEEGAGLVVSVSPDAVNAGNEGKLVHTSGSAQTTETLSDPDFGVSLVAIKLDRDVEMFQWKQEKKTKTEGSNKTTTYTYTEGWQDDLIGSDSFEEPAGHRNPASMPYEDRSLTAQTVTVGAFTLSAEQIGNLSASDVYTPPTSSYTIQDGYLYLASEPSSPKVGDVRVRYKAMKPGPVSLIAKQSGSSFSSYQTDAGNSISMIQSGTAAAADMFAAAQSANVVMTWVLRLVGFMMIFGGLNMLIGPLRVVGERIPFIGGLFGAGMSLVTFLLAAAASLIIISLAWLTARPLLGIVLLLLGGGAMVGAVFLVILAGRKLKAAAT
ncbi:MAG: hypothetical protein ACI8RZ_000887 [Myxococcota bacterium]|jgi:hypothetical protein